MASSQQAPQGPVIFSYRWGRYFVALLLAVGVVLQFFGVVRISGNLLEVGVTTLKLMPAIGLACVGMVWLARRLSDVTGWLAMASSVLLIAVWLFG